MSRSLACAVALLGFAAFPGCGRAGVVAGTASGVAAPVVKVGEQRLPAPPAGSPAAVDRPAFDAGGKLVWDGSPVTAPDAGACGEDAVAQRVARRLAPRVDEVRCAGGAAVLAGIDGGRVAWRRALGFRSGPYTLEETVAGAGPGSLVLNDLAVLDARTGETLVPPPTHQVGAERRPVPDHQVAGAALYLPQRRAFLVFAAEVSLVRREGGLYLLDPAKGTRDLVLPVAATLLGGHWRVAEMAASADGRYVFLAQRQAVRGPGGAAFAVLDLRERRLVLTERFAEKHYVRDPALVLGPSGDVGFAFLDETAGERVLVHYRP